MTRMSKKKRKLKKEKIENKNNSAYKNKCIWEWKKMSRNLNKTEVTEIKKNNKVNNWTNYWVVKKIHLLEEIN